MQRRSSTVATEIITHRRHCEVPAAREQLASLRRPSKAAHKSRRWTQDKSEHITCHEEDQGNEHDASQMHAMDVPHPIREVDTD
eukprot:4492747-Amphidinium_carterae.1